MKKLSFFILCVSLLTGSASILAQAPADTTIYYAFDKKPSFPGGNDARITFLAQHIRYPMEAKNNHVTGKVYASFIVEPNGTVTHIKILKGLGHGCDAEVKRLLLQMPRWEPGMVRGKPVRSYVAQVISFHLIGNVPGTTNKIYTKVDSLPVFAVGKEGVEHFLISQLWYPKRTVKRKVVDTVKVSFVVEKDNRISHLDIIQPKTDYKNAYEWEAMRVVSLLPVTKPAIVNNNPVRVRLYVPVVFDHKNVNLTGGQYKTQEYNLSKYTYFVPKNHLPVILPPKKTVADLQEVPNTNPVFAIVETMPEFPGGMDSLGRYIDEHLRYPIKAAEEGCSGTVFVHFIVEKDGSVSHPTVLRGVCPELDKEAISIISQLPKWSPGKQKGKPVKVAFNTSVTFSLAKTKVATGNKKSTAVSDPVLIYTKPDKMPEFPEGIDGLMHYLTNNIHYPAEARAKGCSGKIYLHFIVEKDGSISHIKVLKGICPLLDKEAIDVVANMPRWIPGYQKGQPVRVEFNLPLKFSM